jgi:hypothetical protein
MVLARLRQRVTSHLNLNRPLAVFLQSLARPGAV